MRFMIETDETERLNSRLRARLATYDAWMIESEQPLEIISQNLINAAKACGWIGHCDCVDWARERVEQ